MPQIPGQTSSPVERKSYVGAWIITLLLIVVFILGLLMYPPIFEVAKDAPKAPESILFIGRFHPIVVHLPIGALMVLALFELACLSRKNEEKLGPAVLLTLIIGAAGSVAGVLVGILLSREGGYEGGNYVLHQAMGIGATAGILLALTLRLSAMGSGHSGMMDCYRILFFLSLAFLSLGAHFGGNMSHGNKFLVDYAPPAIKAPMVSFEKWMLSLVEKPKAEKPKTAPPKPETPAPAPVKPAASTTPAPTAPPPANTPAPANPPAAPASPLSTGDTVSVAADDSALVFQNVILPMLEVKCNKCHNEAKSKGDLRMDTHELLLKGGEGEPGKTVIPGKADESLAISRIKLPIDDDDHMPPEGKDQMTADETALLHWWIQTGASNSQKVKDAKFPAKMKALVESLLKK